MGKIFEFLIPTLFYILPVAGATYTIGKIFYRQIVDFKKTQESGSTNFYGFIKLVGIFIFLVWGCLLSIFLIVVFWFPNIEIPKSIRITGLFLLIPYILCVGALYGLTRVIESGAGSATGILKGLTDMVSGEQSGKKE
ncbi:hypothetical protein [Desulfatitalea tepidiphila]|uniref:hypothetical protein n=1 Tax=Desulfatitalea tepidiphila TaxID=1185843 RepID=UPI00128FC6DA|nr:hypothetical protein [Desulfatitalea tepidiphila]